MAEYFLALLVKFKDRLKLVKGSDKDETGTNF